jgi:hypothetical protein
MSTLHRIAGCENDARQADVVFLHGLGGDPFTTWRHGKDDSTSWPHWLGGAFPNVGVWSLGYAASPTVRFRPVRRLWAWLRGRDGRDIGRSMPLPDRAGEVLNLAVQRGLGQRPLLVICHSLGGLLAKQVLRKSAEATDARLRGVFDHTRAVLFLATPHTGAQLASLLDAFQGVFGTTVSLEDLRAHDAHLRELFDWYRNHSPPRIQTSAYFETRKTVGFSIVDATSAHPGVGRDPVGQDEDHLSIAKPRDREAAVYGAACELLRDFVLSGARPAAAVAAALPGPLPVPAVPPVVVNVAVVAPEPRAAGVAAAERSAPCELPRRAPVEFVGRRQQLEQLTARLHAGLDTAVVGPGGFGKTALAAEAVRAVVGDRGERLTGVRFRTVSPCSICTC